MLAFIAASHVITLDFISLLIYLLIAAVVGLLAEFLVGWRLRFGVLGAIIVGLIGIWLGVWLTTNVIRITNLPTWQEVRGVPIIPALIGSIILVAIWHLVTYPFWRGRRR